MPPKVGAEFDHRFDDLADVMGAEADRQRVDTGERLEDDALPFHHRQDRLRAHHAEAEGGRTIRDDRDGVAAHGLLERFTRMVLDIETGLRHAGRVDRAQDARVGDPHLGSDADQSGVLLPVAHRLAERWLAARTWRRPAWLDVR